MYLVHEGTVEIFIDAKKNEIEMPQTYTLSVDAKDAASEEKKTKVKRSKFKSQLLVINSAQGKTKVAEKGPGEIFGDIALLFAGPRSAWPMAPNWRSCATAGESSSARGVS